MIVRAAAVVAALVMLASPVLAQTTSIVMLAAGVAYARQPAAAQNSAAAQKSARQHAADASERAKIARLPTAVRATVEAESKDVTVKGISTEKANGKTVYELETLVNGRTRDLMIDATGKTYVVEEQLDVAAAPLPVRAAMEAKGTIVALESVTKDGKTTYEGQVRTKGGRKIAVEVDAAGRPIKP